jgi:hypothetical protein
MAEAIPRLQRSPAMSTLRAYQEPDPFESHRTEKGPLFHQCPVCNTDHEVTPVRAQFAYGRQLSCSPDCEAERRRRSRAAYRRALTLVRTDAPAISRPLGTSARLVDEKSLQLKLMISESAPAGAFLKAPGDTEANCTVTAEDREFSGSARQHSRHAATAGEHKAVVTAIVESADVLQVRSAIFQTGGDSVDILKTAPVPHSSKVRVFICMKLGALDSIMTAIMRSVSACEFGRVVRM